MSKANITTGAFLQQVVDCLNHLVVNFKGWDDDYTGDEQPDFALSLLQEAVDALLPIPSEPDLQKLKRTTIDCLLQLDFFYWGAFDPETRTYWNPLQESYEVFAKRHPKTHPFVVNNIEESSRIWRERLESMFASLSVQP